jgi:AhpD family alkylhydroperoxidase
MSRRDLETEIEQTLGQVPEFFKQLPDEQFAREWETFKEFQLGDTELSAREKHLIGYAVAAAIHCPYCTYFHHSATEMMGSTSRQLEEARRMASETQKWSTYLHGMQLDISEFRRQSDEMGEYLRTHAEQQAA